ncbi:MAG: FISUMP domain-containing protein [Bacteroidota bacterium]|nr:FISUMP domain-containing protein [Bacteroidota bacterium]
MRSRQYIQVIIMGLLLFVLSNCVKDDLFKFDDSIYVMLDKPDRPTDRLDFINDPIPFKKFKGSQATSGDELTFTLEYLLNSPVVDGASVQATHIVYKSEKLYLSYNSYGDLIRGGMEVVDFANPGDPKVMAVGIRDAEFSSLDIHTNSTTGKSHLIMAGAGFNAQGAVGSQIRIFDLDPSGYPLMNPEIIDLGGFTATDINALGVVTGTQGGFYEIDEQGLNSAYYITDLEDARSVAYNPDNGEYVALLGNPGRLVTGLPANQNTSQLDGISFEGTKAIVRIRDGLAYAALGDGGLRVIDLSSGLITASINRPEIPSGQNERNYVTNGVSVNESGHVFIANGAAGVYVAKITDLGHIEILGYLDLDASVNYVESYGNYLFVAAGEKGVAIIRMEGLNGPLPVVDTRAPDKDGITDNSAVGGGSVDQNGGEEVLNKGICWSTDSQPTIFDFRTSHGPGEGSFVSNLTGLMPGTRYYLRAYATTSIATYYGEENSFSTLGSGQEFSVFTDQRDGQVYRYTEIGQQIWMTENLAYLTDVSPVASGSLIAPFYYVYNYNGFNVEQAKASSSYQNYGVLYNWNAAKVSCPDGWHLPSDQEWIEMERFLGMDGNEALANRFRNTGMVGDQLKTTSGWFNEENGSNSSGFSALPAGYRVRGGEYKSQGSYASYWTADEDGFMAISRGLYYFNDGVYRANWYKSAGFSVRCIKD